MKKYILLVAICVSGISFGQNLISNGNFEANKDDWDGFNNQVLKDDITNSYVGNINNGESSLFQVFSAEAGKTYKVAFNYRWVSGNGNYNINVIVKSGETDGTDLQTLTLNSIPNTWFTGSFSFTLPENETQARIIFYKTNQNRPLRIDNVVVFEDNFHPTFVDTNTPINSQPNGVPGNWVLEFSDEFEGDNLNLTKWYKSESTKTRAPRENLGVTDWRWIAENAFLNNNGQLVLRATKINNTTMRCGSIESRGLYEVQYGYLEARIKIAKTAKGNHTAFWLQGENQSNVDNSAADGAEVDIFESAWVSNTTKAVVHYDGYGADRKNHTIPSNVPNMHNEEFHTFGLLWTENTMDIYYDGTKVTSTQASKPFPFSTNPVNGHDLVPKVKEWLWLSVGASFGDGDFQSQPTGLLSDALVEYVRVFKPSAALSANSFLGNNEGVKVYPNPTKDVLHIKSDQQKYQISIFDVNGKQILKKNSNDFITSINTKTYISGIYFLKIVQNNQIILKKIIIE
jgi:beta-glucanase (GH16 family)